MRRATEHHHGRPSAVVGRRVAAVLDRLDVAMEFRGVDESVAAQVLHAVEYAASGPPGRTDDDYLDVTVADALALMRALLPYMRAARSRPGFEACAEHGWPDESEDE